MKIAVVGAGIGGLTAAIALRRAGHSIEIFEQAEMIAPMGAALSIWPNALGALDEIGLGDPLRAVAMPLDDVALADWTGSDISRFSVSALLDGARACLPTRTQLQRMLMDHLADVPLHLDHHLESYTDDGAEVTLSFQNGKRKGFDMLVAADGIWSNIASMISGDKPKYAGYGGVLALTPAGSSTNSGLGRGTEYWGKGERIGLFDVADGRKYWFYMKSGCREAEAAALTTAMLAKRMAHWPDEIATILSASDDADLIPFVVHAKPKPKRLAAGRIILLGDAAHAMEPNMGQGACQAIEDAVTLGLLAQGDVAAAELGRLYERQRLKRVGQFVAMSAQGSIAPHKLPSALIPPTYAVMRAIFPPLVRRQIARMFDWQRVRWDLPVSGLAG